MFLRSHLLVAGLIPAILALVAANGCVTSPSSGGGGFMGGGGSNPVIMKLDGRDIKADEVLKSPVFRQSIRQWAAIEHIKQQAAAEGIVANREDIDKKMADQKQQMLAFGQKWEDVLKHQGMTETEVVQMLEFQDISDQYAKKLAGDISDEELQAEWEKNQDRLRTQYASEHYLPESEKKAVNFEKVKDWLKEQLGTQRSMEVQQKLFTDALKEIQLDLPPLGSKEEQESYIQLIIKSQIPEDTPEPIVTDHPGENRDGTPIEPEAGTEPGAAAGGTAVPDASAEAGASGDGETKDDAAKDSGK